MKNPWPILWFDADNRLQEMEVAQKHIEAKRLHVWTIKAPLIEDRLRARHTNFEVRGKMRTLGPPRKEPKGYLEFLEQMDAADKFIEENAIRTVVFDPMTRVIEHMMRYLSFKTGHGVIEKSAWGIFLSNWEEVINVSLTFPCNVLHVYHDRDFFDEEGGYEGTEMLISGQMRPKLGSYFGEVWHMEPDAQQGAVNWRFRTSPTKWIACRTSKGLSEYEDVSFPLLYKKGGDIWDKKWSVALFGPYGSGKSYMALSLCDVEVE